MSQENKQSVIANEKGSPSKDVKSPQGAAAGEDINQFAVSCKLHAGVDVNHNRDRRTGAGGPRTVTLPTGSRMIKLEGNSIFQNMNYFTEVLENGLGANVPFSVMEVNHGDETEIVQLREDV